MASMSRSNVGLDALTNWYEIRLCVTLPVSDIYVGIASPRMPAAVDVIKLAGEIFDIYGPPKLFN